MKLEKLENSHYYHIYNRGINSESIFRSNDNKDYFLMLFNKYLGNKVDVLAYCLMKNHFHFVIRLNEDENIITQAFSNFFNAYAKAYNKQQSRTGSLFEKHFRRKRIDSENYLRNVIMYVHHNPLHHGASIEIDDYKYSSFQNFIKNTNPNSMKIDEDFVIKLFDSLENLKILHHSFKEDDSLGVKIQESARSDLQGSQNLAGQKKDCSQSQTNLTGLSTKDKFYNYILTLQDTITAKLEVVDGEAKFQEDLWERAEGGGGRTRVIENGKVFEKGGVNISAVHGELPESMQQYFGVKDANFFACGLSLVLHPKNPMVPTVHANWRYFEMYDQEGNIVDSWFGGGQDLTPYYLFDEDAIHFHQICKTACDKHHPDFYELYKKRCDEYFWNSHRNEARGVGGLFFDYCKSNDDMNMEDWYNFVTEVGDSFLAGYVPIVEKRKELPYSNEQRKWQEIRRGRYVEFNLVHDKGTLFGLKTNGRIESILMSLPPHVQWVYDHHPENGSEEEKLIKTLKKPIDWVEL